MVNFWFEIHVLNTHKITLVNIFILTERYACHCLPPLLNKRSHSFSYIWKCSFLISISKINKIICCYDNIEQHKENEEGVNPFETEWHFWVMPYVWSVMFLKTHKMLKYYLFKETLSFTIYKPLRVSNTFSVLTTNVVNSSQVFCDMYFASLLFSHFLINFNKNCFRT